VIDRESRIKKAWNDDESNEDAFESDEEKEEKKPREEVKKSKRPTNKKFSEIMKANDAFPTLENNFEGAEEYEEVSDEEEK
jgi:hypothetical protein